MKELVEFVARGLVDDPEAVHVEEREQRGELVLALEVGEGDIGKVIGKKGRTAKAIRVLLAAAAARSDRRTSLEIVE